MKFLRIAEITARVGLTLSGAALAAATAVGLAPGGCNRGLEKELVAQGSRPALFRAMLASGPVWELGRVVRVIDGDTYELLVNGALLRVRLLGADAPEASQPFGQQATDSARAMLQGRLVSLQRQGTDLYGRTLGAVRVPVASRGPAPVAVALDSILVVLGWAWAFDPNRTVAGRAQQQLAALRASRGLWKCGESQAVPPKVWRGLNAQNKRRYAGSCAW